MNEGRWTELARFWNAGRLGPLPFIAMIKLTCDESNDGNTYAIAGWFASPEAWDIISDLWNEMLVRHHAPEFHAAEIVGRDQISDSRFKNWTREQEIAFFTEAIDIIVNKKCSGWPMSIGMAISVPAMKNQIPMSDDAIWFILFCRLIHDIAQIPAARDINLLFDEKRELRHIVNAYFYKAKEAVNKTFPNRFDDAPVGFTSSIKSPPIQAADLLVFEWRRRISRRLAEPNSKERISFMRLKERPCALVRYSPQQIAQIQLPASDDERIRGGAFLEAIWEMEPIDELKDQQ